VTEPRDQVDDWLDREVEPLAPPPGTFERIHHRARRRKRHQAVAAAAGAVVVIAGAVLVPTLAPGLLPGGHHGPPQPAASASRSAPTPRPTPTPKKSTSHPASPTTGPAGGVAGQTGLSQTSSGTSPPDNFRPTSITMIGESVGAVIGQAGTPGHCGPPVKDDCTSLAGTSNYGDSWYGISAPVTSAPDGSSGVSQLRFLNLSDGWAFGPALYTTSNGGRSWTAEQTFGKRVIDLETGGSRAFALLASCRGSGASYAAGCTKFALFTSAAGSTRWRKVALEIPASLRASAMGAAGESTSASLVIKGDAASPEEGTGYLLSPAGLVLSGPLDGGAWKYAGSAGCQPGAAAAGGAPLGAQLTIDAGKLLLDCAYGSSVPQARQVRESADGSDWTGIGAPSGAGLATSLGGTSSGQAVLATTAGIEYSANARTWHHATIVGGSPAGGFSYVGMTSTTQGVALPADASLGEAFTTRDGGRIWTPSRITG
jgi:hypothetical protein